MNKVSKRPFVPCAATVAAFTAANGLISAPYFPMSILPFFAAAVCAAVIVAVTQFLFIKITCIGNSFFKKTVYLLISISSVAAAVFALREYSRFIFDDVLVRENYFVIKAILTFCVYCLAVSKENVIYKFAFLSAVLISAVFVGLFFTSVKTFDAENIKSALVFSDFSLKETAVYFSKMFLPSLLAAVFICEDQKAIKAGLLGTAWAFLLGAVVLLDCILSFSLPLASKLDYPYIDDISTVTVGSLFTRMDGFAYIAFFVCYLIKCGVCVSLCGGMLQNAGIRRKRIVTAAVCAAALLLA